MKFKIKKILFNTVLNLSFFLIIMVSIQNSNNKEQVRFLSYETVYLPLSFLLGTNFIFGSLCGSLLSKGIEKNN